MAQASATGNTFKRFCLITDIYLPEPERFTSQYLSLNYWQGWWRCFKSVLLCTLHLGVFKQWPHVINFPYHCPHNDLLNLLKVMSVCDKHSVLNALSVSTSEAVIPWVSPRPRSRPSSLRSRCATRGSPNCHWTAACFSSSCSFCTCWLRCLSSTLTSTGRSGGTRTATPLPLPRL